MDSKYKAIYKAMTSENIGALADAFECSFVTIQRWIANHDDRLTSDKAKQVLIRKGLLPTAEPAHA